MEDISMKKKRRSYNHSWF